MRIILTVAIVTVKLLNMSECVLLVHLSDIPFPSDIRRWEVQIKNEFIKLS